MYIYIHIYVNNIYIIIYKCVCYMMLYVYIIPFNRQPTRGFEHSFGDHSLNTITIIAVTKKDIRSIKLILSLQ